MKNYKLKLDNYELTLLKYLVYQRKNLLQKKCNEVPECMKAGILSAFNSSKKLLKKLVNLSKNSYDFYNYDLLERKDMSYNEYIKENSNVHL